MNETQRPSSRVWSVAAVLLFLVVMVCDAVYCVRHAAAPIDSMAYASLTSGVAGNTFGAEVQEWLKDVGVPVLGYSDQTDQSVIITSEYSAESYRQFLRFYEVKPAYVFLLRRLHRNLHMSVFGAMKTVSVASFLGMGIVLWFWFREHFSVVMASLLAITLMNTQFVLTLGKMLLPDGFSVALLLLAVYLLLYLRNKWPGAVVLFLLPVVRPDNLIFACLFAAALLWRTRYPVKTRLRYVLLLLAGCAALYLVMQKLTHPLPWAALFYHSSLGWTDPSTYAGLHISLHAYLRVLVSFGGRALLLHFPLALFFAALALAGRNVARPLRDLVWVSVATVSIRLLLFPSMEERFYTWFLLVCAIAAACNLGELLKLSKPSPTAVDAGAPRR
jgi:hypothetical protein